MKSRPNPQILTDYNILTISTELIHFHVHFGNVCGIYICASLIILSLGVKLCMKPIEKDKYHFS